MMAIAFRIGAAAQPIREAVIAFASQAPDLVFPENAQALSAFSPLRMALYKPDGEGPFPALVMVHSCGGLRQEMLVWAAQAVSHGYVVFVLDSLAPRGLKSVCNLRTPVNIHRGAKDAFQALDHLKKFAFVDPQRIGLIGFSWGAMVGLLVSGNRYAEIFSTGKRFAAVASFYPMCYRPAMGGLRELEFVQSDTDRPLLVLMGALDTETPPSDCLPRLQRLKEKDAPIEWHLYPQATHCWDCSSMHNFSKVDFLGNEVVYRYDRDVTRDSAKRTFDFLAIHLKARP